MAVFLESNGHVMDAELRCEAAQVPRESLGRFRPAGRGRNPQGWLAGGDARGATPPGSQQEISDRGSEWITKCWERLIER